jgi:hypothetical protein
MPEAAPEAKAITAEPVPIVPEAPQTPETETAPLTDTKPVDPKEQSTSGYYVRNGRTILHTVWRSDDPIETASEPETTPDNSVPDAKHTPIETASEPETMPDNSVPDAKQTPDDDASEPETADPVRPPMPEREQEATAADEPLPNVPDKAFAPGPIRKPRKLYEKPTPAKRPAILHPIKRMEH